MIDNSLSFEKLNLNAENVKIVSSLILLDESGKCFSNKDTEGNVIPLEYMAEIYLEYTIMYGIKLENEFIGLLSLTNENEISIFIAPKHQHLGIGTESLRRFLDIVQEEHEVKNSIIAEITENNPECISLLSKFDFKKTDESREVPINGEKMKVIKYVKKI